MILLPAALVAVTFAHTGCQTPKHTNTLIFGTNTRVGLDVGYDPKQQSGGILVGYQRQEAVWMPLLANTADSGTEPGPKAATSPRDHLFTGWDGQGTDTYSVIASIGAEFNGKAGTSAEAGGGWSRPPSSPAAATRS